MLAARVLSFVILAVAPALARGAASLILTPRFENAVTRDENIAQRSMLRGKLTADFGPYNVYIEAFGEAEWDENRRIERRIEGDRAVALQEAYVEMKLGSFFVRAGKQALRWSEMWTLPSLDVWTARRWNRFLFDPQPEQFDHSGGVSATYAADDGFSAEAFFVTEMARSRYPAPLPEFLDEKSDDASGGARVKLNLGEFGFSAVAARAGKRDVVGGSVNRAFESFVPKLEIGRVRDRSIFPLAGPDSGFLSLGVDVFRDSWTFQPQVAIFDLGDLSADSRDYQALYYLSGTWLQDGHDLQFQLFRNTSTEDSFVNVFYGYSWKDWCQIGGFVQNYEGTDGGLFTLYKAAADGGLVMGARLELNTSFGN